MSYLRNIPRLLLIALPLHAVLAEPLEVVLQNGKSIPVSSLSMQGGKFVVTTAVEGFPAGHSFALDMADHVYGEKPPEINQAIALILTDKANKAQALLSPIVKTHEITSKIPGNYWLDAARALLVAHALSGDAANAEDIGKKISDATPAQGSDPFVMLGKALLIPIRTANLKEREMALRDLITGNQPTDLCAFASFFHGRFFKAEKKPAEALEAFLTVPCLYPSGDPIINAAAEIEAADLLASLNRGQEALALVQSALRASTGTVLADEAALRMKSLKQ